MNQLRLDENLAVREILDDIVGMFDRREKLIASAEQVAEDTRDTGMAAQVKQLEALMTDFLNLFDPVLVRIKAYGEKLKQSVSDSEAFLRSLVEIIDAGKTVDGSSATMKELERDANEVQYELNSSSEILTMIENLFRRTKRYASQESGAKSSVLLEPSSRNLSRSDGRYVTAKSYSGQSVEPTRKVSAFTPSTSSKTGVASQSQHTRPHGYSGSEADSGPSLTLTEETRNRIEDLFSGKRIFDRTDSSPSEKAITDQAPRTTKSVPNSEARKLRPFVWAPARSSSDESP